MPLHPEVIDEAILRAFTEAGVASFRIPAVSRHPRIFRLVRDQEVITLWVYAWGLTHGGRRTLPNEFRIQITGVESPLELNPSGWTVLLGYDPERNLFAGFDLRRHQHFGGRSPSVQIDVRVLDEAQLQGLSFGRKSNGELAIGIRPDLLLFYCEHHFELHAAGADAVVMDLLDRAVDRQVVHETELTPLPAPRRRLVQEVSRVTRSASFRRQVLAAYDHRCAVTGMQLRLIDAAHILPVSAGPESLDIVQNGIALSPSYHRAFDVGLIYLTETFEMRLNHQKAHELQRIGLADGLADFAAPLGPIRLPVDRSLWPSVYYIRRGNEVRGIPA